MNINSIGAISPSKLPLPSQDFANTHMKRFLEMKSANARKKMLNLKTSKIKR